MDVETIGYIVLFVCLLLMDAMFCGFIALIHSFNSVDIEKNQEALGEKLTAKLRKIEEKAGLCIYNLGTGNGYSVLEIVNTFKCVNDIDVNYKITDRRPGDIATCYSNPEKAKKERRLLRLCGMPHGRRLQSGGKET